MPKTPNRPCREYRCPNYAVKDGYCLEHWMPRDQRYPREKTKIDLRYSRITWQKLRKMVLRIHPICTICNRSAATVAHHILAVDDGGEFYDLDNLTGVCRKCHEKEHRR